MNKKELVKKIILESGGIAKTEIFKSMGLSNSVIANLCNEGYITRIRHGYYKLGNEIHIKEEQLIASMLPEAIICMESALFHYGYSDFTPRYWNLAVSRTFSKSRLCIEGVKTKIYYIQNPQLELGKIVENINGVDLFVYDRERTICDCFKYRTRLDNELFNKAINAYVKDPKKNLFNLSIYAKQMNNFKKVMNIMEVVLNGLC